MSRNHVRAGLVVALVTAGLLLTLVRPVALGMAPHQATATPGLPTRPGLTILPTVAPTAPVTATMTVAPTATFSPTVAPLPTATPPSVPTARPTSRPTDEPPPTVAPALPPDTPQPTLPPAALPTAGVARPAWPWWLLIAGLAVLAGAALLRRNR